MNRRTFLLLLALLPWLLGCDTVVDLLTFDGPSAAETAVDPNAAETDDPNAIFTTPITETAALPPLPTATATPTLTPTPEPTPTPAFDLPQPGHRMVVMATLAEGERHHYNFVATDLGTITAVVTPFDGFDVVLEIRDAADELLLLVDEFFGEERLTFTGPEPLGRYALVVRGFEDEAGDYRLTLDGNTGITPFLLDGDEILSVLGLASRLEYAIPLNVGQTVTAVIQPDPNLDIKLQLYDLDENLLIEVRDGGPGQPETLTYSSLATGVYFLVARTGLGNVGQFTLRVGIE
jgi:hypothetical protein